MRFLVDAQLSRRLVHRLAERGHESHHVFDHLPGTAGDPEVAVLAERLDAALISMDADFVDLSRRGVLRRPLVWVRTGNIRTDVLWTRLEPILPEIVSAIAQGVTIVEVR
jgi:predicted nuclease of predicted toxin-antitoxin system